MNDKSKNMHALRGLLCAFLLILVILSCAFLGLGIVHDCRADECYICRAVCDMLDFSAERAVMLCEAVFYIGVGACILVCALHAACYYLVTTPVLQKVKLLN